MSMIIKKVLLNFLSPKELLNFITLGAIFLKTKGKEMCYGKKEERGIDPV